MIMKTYKVILFLLRLFADFWYFGFPAVVKRPDMFVFLFHKKVLVSFIAVTDLKDIS